MNLAELQKRLEECFVSQRENEKVYLKEALMCHQKLNEFIQENGESPEIEKKITETLEIIKIYESFDEKILTYIESLNKEIDQMIN